MADATIKPVTQTTATAPAANVAAPAKTEAPAKVATAPAGEGAVAKATTTPEQGKKVNYMA